MMDIHTPRAYRWQCFFSETARRGGEGETATPAVLVRSNTTANESCDSASDLTLDIEKLGKSAEILRPIHTMISLSTSLGGHTAWNWIAVNGRKKESGQYRLFHVTEGFSETSLGIFVEVSYIENKNLMSPVHKRRCDDAKNFSFRKTVIGIN